VNKASLDVTMNPDSLGCKTTFSKSPFLPDAVNESISDKAIPFIQNQLNDDSKKTVNNYNEYLIQYGFQKFAGK